jgi:hypothetical protein
MGALRFVPSIPVGSSEATLASYRIKQAVKLKDLLFPWQSDLSIPSSLLEWHDTQSHHAISLVLIYLKLVDDPRSGLQELARLRFVLTL